MTAPFFPDQAKHAKSAAQNWEKRAFAMRNLGVDPQKLRGVVEYDIKRVQQGQAPLSDREAAMIARAVIRGEPTISAPEGDTNPVLDFLGNIPEEIKQITTMLPQLPRVMAEEVQAIPDAPRELQKAMNKRDTRDKIAALSQVPGLRLVPGLYTAGGLAQDGPGFLAEHPVTSFLDILPITKATGVNAAIAGSKPAVTAKAHTPRFLDEHGLGGERLRGYTKSLAQADREAELQKAGFAGVNAKVFEGWTPEMHEQMNARWTRMTAEERARVPQELRAALEHIEQTNAETRRVGQTIGDLWQHPDTGEWLSTKDPKHRAAKSRFEAAERAAEDFARVERKYQHAQERLGLDKARVEQKVSTPVDELVSLADSARTGTQSLLEPAAERIRADRLGDGGLTPDTVWLSRAEQGWMAGERSPAGALVPKRSKVSNVSSVGKQGVQGERNIVIAPSTDPNAPGWVYYSDRQRRLRRELDQLSARLDPMQELYDEATRWTELRQEAKVAKDLGTSVIRKWGDNPNGNGRQRLAPSRVLREMEKSDPTRHAQIVAEMEAGVAAERSFKLIEAQGALLRKRIRKAEAAGDLVTVKAEMKKLQKMLDAEDLRVEKAIAGVQKPNLKESYVQQPHPLEKQAKIYLDRIHAIQAGRATATELAGMPEAKALQVYMDALDDLADQGVRVKPPEWKMAALTGEKMPKQYRAGAKAMEAQEWYDKLYGNPTTGLVGLFDQFGSAMRGRDYETALASLSEAKRGMTKLGKYAEVDVSAQVQVINDLITTVRAHPRTERASAHALNRALASREALSKIEGKLEEKRAILEKRRKAAEVAQAHALPARFQPLIGDIFQQRIKERALGNVEAGQRLVRHEPVREVVMGKDGEPVMVSVTDAEGNVRLEPKTRLKREEAPTDEAGNPLLDEKGKPIKGAVVKQPVWEPLSEDIRGLSPEEVLRRVEQQDFEGLINPAEFSEITREVVPMWETLKNVDGYDPVFIHRPGRNQFGRAWQSGIAFQRISTPGQFRGRALLPTTHDPSIEVALTDQQAQIVNRMAQEKVNEEVLMRNIEDGGVGMFRGQVIAAEATRIAREMKRAQKRGQPLTLAEATDLVIGKYYKMYNPSEFMPFSKGDRPPRIAGDNQTVISAAKADEAYSQAIKRSFIARQQMDELRAAPMPNGKTKWDLLPQSEKKRLSRDASDIDAVAAELAGMELPAQVYLPRSVYKVTEQMLGAPSGSPSIISSGYDKGMDAFRVFALGLSPRFAMYNVVGGLIMALTRTGPSLVQDLAEARKLIGSFSDYRKVDGRIPEIDSRLSRGPGVAPEMATKFSTATKGAGHTAVGKTYGKIWEVLKGGANWNFTLGSWVDDMYRVATMLYGERKGLAKGMSKDMARLEGVKLANKVLQDWDGMLPWERKILRNVFPFYGWLKHILTYTMTLPFDHPLRVSIVSTAIANELEDMNDPVLGTRFNSMIWWGGDDPYGTQWTANLAGLNPFNDVADSLTWAGFVSQLSPLIQGGLETMGVDVVSARSSLYPQATYDPETGRLVAQGKNPVESMVGAFVPQSEALMQALGGTQSARELARRDPEAARARIFSALGIPGSVRQRNYSEEVAKAELARSTAATDAVNRAIRTGEWSDALRYDQAFVDIDKKRPGAELVDPALLQELLARAQG